MNEDNTFKMTPPEFYGVLLERYPGEEVMKYDRYLDRALFVLDSNLRDIRRDFLSFVIGGREFHDRLDLSNAFLMAQRRYIKEYYTEEQVSGYRKWRAGWESRFTNTNETKDDATKENAGER